MIEGYRAECPLCRLAQDREILTRLVAEDDLIIVVDCLLCQVPMAVLKAHRAQFTEEEKEHIRHLLRLNRFKRQFNGEVIDWEQRRIPDHAHCHLRPCPFPGTKQWEKISPVA